MARNHGHYLVIDIRVGVDPHITVEQGHLISKEVKKALLATATSKRSSSTSTHNGVRHPLTLHRNGGQAPFSEVKKRRVFCGVSLC
ncbi:cation transporter dimerization domain-containing protein [Mesobacillus campisalis]|uniref:cation transporter dimerization domain-containing protein n=1 Tax=Mesobacillus campisalis TaxID=1408103 RepID=UPI001F4C6C29|nr:cation transporter dimerization domain-containing protein [Mesobacillus campisalis]